MMDLHRRKRKTPDTGRGCENLRKIALGDTGFDSTHDAQMKTAGSVARAAPALGWWDCAFSARTGPTTSFHPGCD